MSTQDYAKPDDHEDPTVAQTRGRVFGHVLGTVQDRDDPQQRGRIRVHVAALFPGDPTREQHWTDWLLPKGHWLRVPPIGAPVIVTFELGSITSGSYSWGWFKGSSATDNEVAPTGKGQPDPTYLGEATVAPSGAGFPADYVAPVDPADPAASKPPRYPDNYVSVSPAGHLFEEDNSEGEPRFRYRHPTGTTFLVDPAGNVHVRSKGGVHWNSEGDYTIHLARGQTYRVECEDGPSLIIGPTGIHAKAHILTLQGRVVSNNRMPIR